MRHALQPALLEDESILGYLQRFSLLVYRGEFRPLVRSLIPIKAVQAPWLIPSCLESLAAALEALPTPDVLLTKHTIVPTVTAFLERDERDEIAKKLLGPTGGQGVYFRLGLAHSLTESRRATQNFCPVCVDESITKYGHSYWRRTHQFPYIGTCGVHGELLRTGSGCCSVTKRNSNSSYLPGRGCSCESPSVDVLPQSVSSLYLKRDRAVSKFLVEAMTVEWPEMTPGNINLLYRHAAKQRGFAHGSYIDSVALSAAFQDFFGLEFLNAYSSNSEAETGWIAEAFRGGIPKSVVRNALIIHFLFGDLSGFLQHWHAGEWRSATPPARRGTGTHRKWLARPFDMDRLNDMRSQLLSWKASTDESPTRTAAQRVLATAVNYVRVHDREWYDEHFPIVPRRQFADAMSQTWLARHRDAERAATEQVLKNYEELLGSSSLPVRVTRPPLARGLSAPLSKLPDTLKVVNTLLETKVAYNERKAVWLYLNSPVDMPEVDKMQNAYERTRVPKFRIQELLKERDRLSR